MINKDDFKEMEKETKKFDDQREQLIKKSRDVLKLSKKIIYSIHREDLKDAENNITKINLAINDLNDFVTEIPQLYYQGSYKVAIQEYGEALLFYGVVKNDKLPSRKDLNIDTDYYLLALTDLTGELSRKIIRLATKEEYQEVIKLSQLLDDIYSQLLNFDFRNGELRRKFDSIKYELKKIEELKLNLKMRKLI